MCGTMVRILGKRVVSVAIAFYITFIALDSTILYTCS